jgi:hypothetical protein
MICLSATGDLLSIRGQSFTMLVTRRNFHFQIASSDSPRNGLSHRGFYLLRYRII